MVQRKRHNPKIMKIPNESLATAAEIKTENMGRTFFNVGKHMLSYFFFNGKHIVPWTVKFWDNGVLNSVGQREEFTSESATLKFITEKAKYFNSNPV